MSHTLGVILVCGVIACSAAVAVSPLWAAGSGLCGLVLLIGFVVDS